MEFNTNIFGVYDHDWALLTAGEKDHFNTMTISWGGMGTLWGKPVVTVYVKPIRYTHQFMEQNEYFTVSFYAEEYRRALGLLGSRSGRDGDKVSDAGLTPELIKDLRTGKEASVTFKEANVTLLCRKIYHQDLDTTTMPADVVKGYYESEAPHTMYIGEVIDIIKKMQ